MSDDLNKLLITELAEQANRLPEPSLHLDAVRQRSRQRIVRRRTIALGAYGVSAVAMVFAGVLLATRIDTAPDPSIVAGPPEAAAIGHDAEPSDRKSPAEPPPRTPSAEDGGPSDTVNDETGRTIPPTSPASTPTSGSNDDGRASSATATTVETSTTTDQPLASSAEAAAETGAIGASPIPASAAGWEAETADGSIWQQWDGTEACVRRVVPASGYSGEAICFDYIYQDGPWAVEEGSANESVAWYGLNPVGQKRAVELVLSDGTVLPGVVDGEFWMVIVDYTASGLASTSRPERVLVSTATGKQEIPLPSLVADAPGSTIVITAALVPG
ncbi:MAG: hypothetical protein ACR2QO_19135 [Acidimicrobiales bacterium]